MTLGAIGGWLAAAFTIYINWRNYQKKNHESSEAKASRAAGLDLLGWSLRDRLDLESRLTRIENDIESQKELHETLGKLMANVLRTSGKDES